MLATVLASLVSASTFGCPDLASVLGGKDGPTVLGLGFPKSRGLSEINFQSVSKVNSMGVFQGCRQRAVFSSSTERLFTIVWVHGVPVTQRYQIVEKETRHLR